MKAGGKPLARLLRRGAAGGLCLWAVCAGGGACAPRPVKVVFFTDVHARTEWDTPQALAQAAAAITAENADLVVGGGDLITDGYVSTPAQAAPRWDAYLAMHRAIRPAPVVAFGNHDLVGVVPPDGSAPAADPRADFRARFGLESTYRSFDFKGYHFILLDSIEVLEGAEPYRGFIDAEQMDWLRADLARTPPDRPIVLISHLPLLTGFYQATGGIAEPVPPGRGVLNNREVLAAFANHRLLAVLQGHLHVEEQIRWRGTAFLTGGSICGQWWRGPWQGTPEGYGVLLLHPDRVEWQYRPTGWKARRPAGV